MNGFSQSDTSICNSIKSNLVDNNNMKQGIWTLEEKRISEEKGEYYLTAKGCYTNNLRTGIWKFYDITGIVLEEFRYQNDTLHGEAILYYDTGVKKIIENFEKGIPNGMWSYSFPSGETFIQENYINGLLTGECKRFFENGDLEELSTYKEGVKNGKYLLYSQNRILIEEVDYLKGKRNGMWIKYYSTGELKYTSNINDNGFLEGLEVDYYQSGKIKKETIFMDNVKNGDQKFYDQTGKLIKIITFENGRPTNTQVF